MNSQVTRQDRAIFDFGIASVRSEPVFGSSVRQTVELQSGRRMVVIGRAPTIRRPFESNRQGGQER